MDNIHTFNVQHSYLNGTSFVPIGTSFVPLWLKNLYFTGFSDTSKQDIKQDIKQVYTNKLTNKDCLCC